MWWTKLRAAVTTYFTREPVLAPGLLLELTVTVEARGGGRPFIRFYDYNHANLEQARLVQIMADAFIVALATKRADKASVLAYVDAKWPTTP